MQRERPVAASTPTPSKIFCERRDSRAEPNVSTSTGTPDIAGTRFPTAHDRTPTKPERTERTGDVAVTVLAGEPVAARVVPAPVDSMPSELARKLLPELAACLLSDSGRRGLYVAAVNAGLMCAECARLGRCQADASSGACAPEVVEALDGLAGRAYLSVAGNAGPRSLRDRALTVALLECRAAADVLGGFAVSASAS